MPDPADTIREALTKNGVCLICGSGVLADGSHVRDDPCALTELEQQLAGLRTALTKADVTEAEREPLTVALLVRAEAAEAALAKVQEGRDADRRILEGFRDAAEADRDRWQREHENLLNWIEEHVGKGGTQKRLDHLNGPLLANTLREIADMRPDAEDNPFARDVVKQVSGIARAALDRHTTPLDNFDRDDSKRGTDWGIDWGDGAPIQPTLGPQTDAAPDTPPDA